MGFMDKLNDLAKKAQDKIQEVAAKATAPKVATASAPVQDWYYTIDGKTKHGPFSLDQLKKLAEAGQLQPSHMVRQEGTTKWIAAGQVAALWINSTPATPEPIYSPPAQASPPPLPSNTDEKWYYAANGQQAGPVPILQLQELIRAGQLLPTDMVWKEGMAAWAAASSISILFPRTSQAPPPLPPVVATPAMPSKVDANRVTGEIELAAVETRDEDGLDLLLDGERLAAGSLQDGIPNVKFESSVGNHTFTLISISKKQKETHRETFQVELTQAGHHTLKFKPRWLGTFPSCIEKTSYSPKALDVVPVSALRKKSFVGSWQPITDASEWMEFTNDGAVVFSDGTAGRITISGNQPNEVIEIGLVNGQSRQFKVVSLSPDQLVIAENDEATTFRRPPSSSGKRQATGPSDKAEGSAEGTVTMSSSSSESECSARGIVTMSSSSDSDTPVSSSTQWWDCPWCGITYRDDSYNPGETIVCNHCNCQFQVKQAINLRSTKERVEKRNLLGRLWSGSSIQKSRRQILIERISENNRLIRICINPIMSDVQSLQRAQMLEMEIAEMKRELADHGG